MGGETQMYQADVLKRYGLEVKDIRWIEHNQYNDDIVIYFTEHRQILIRSKVQISEDGMKPLMGIHYFESPKTGQVFSGS